MSKERWHDTDTLTVTMHAGTFDRLHMSPRTWQRVRRNTVAQARRSGLSRVVFCGPRGRLLEEIRLRGPRR